MPVLERAGNGYIAIEKRVYVNACSRGPWICVPAVVELEVHKLAAKRTEDA